MAICNWCEKEMSGNEGADSCIANNFVLFPDGEKLLPIPYDPDYGDEDQRCHDCNIKRGGFHHPGCDMERCPKCFCQLISCGCLDEEDEEE